ncbi:MAG: hypothetical protein JWP96_1652, partial [Polaromonas sp.]|nr:hypothetical protein [Polaromonas sp.]
MARRSQLNGNNRNMLTDIFAYRYAGRPIWNGFSENDRILLVQGFRMVSEQLFPEEANFEQKEISKSAWENIHSRLSMELGLERLIQPMHSNPYQTIHLFLKDPKSVVAVCKTWMLAGINEGQDADVFLKHRISCIELAFRERMQVLTNADANQVFIA